ncbi:acyl carrier protein [Sphaerimonospora sp. CA-214678]|uniref:acyl carrier protein n=1 Tax=Sphaerimonospora sp. CA-214678 TaxID=3240029 RepID=UPI003D9111B2
MPEATTSAKQRRDEPAPADPAIPAEEIRQWLCARVADYARCPVAEIRSDLPLSEYGLDSVHALSLCADIEDHYGIEVEPTLLWDHPVLGSLSEALAPLIAAGRT